MKWVTRCLVVILLFVIFFLVTDLASTGREVVLLREQVKLLESNLATREKLCNAQARLSSAYKKVLHQMIQDLGLDRRPEGAVQLVLSVFEESTGMGGPE